MPSRAAKTSPALVAGLLAGLVWGAGAAAPARASDPKDGGRVPDPALTLDAAGDGATVRLTELGEGPYVVAPIFTRCRGVCTVVAKRLKSAWGERGEIGRRRAGGPGGASAQIVLVSFDPEDTPEDMARFRETFDLPASWRLATVGREEGLRFFSALGFEWRTLARRQFDHSGKVFVITDDLRIASVLGPDQLTTERLGAEVEAAKSGGSLARRLGTHWIGFFGVGIVLLGLVLAVTWDRVRSRSNQPPTSHV
jgi:cytochrome oxidase Cu insertion factor (SCO1/SenC/PrrC family)